MATGRNCSPWGITDLPGTAERVRFLQNRIEYRGKVTRRRIDDTQHFRGGRLLLQRRARLGDEASILHRDDRVRGEILK
jgi:hypothetical protein